MSNMTVHKRLKEKEMNCFEAQHVLVPFSHPLQGIKNNNISILTHDELIISYFDKSGV